MDVSKLSESLSPFERAVIKVLDNFRTVEDISKATGLRDIEVVRALQWLQNKNLAKLSEDKIDVVNLDSNGQKYLNEGLPERRFLEYLKKPSTLNDISKSTGLSNEELTISLGLLKSKQAIDIKKGTETVISITDNGKNILKRGFLEEHFLKLKFPIDLSSLNDQERFVLDNLRKRKKIVEVSQKKAFSGELTTLGKNVLDAGINEDLAEKVTSQLIKSGEYKGKKFRRFDIKVNVPQVFGGRKQHYRRFLEEVRQKFIALGFEEMAGPIVETEFWDMDALFMPQFHSARDVHQAYFIKQPRFSEDLPENVVKKVKEAHENGFGTGSKGWRYEFDFKKTSRHILRTHDTSISSRTLASKELKIPGKYFQIARCFRPDVIDATHLPDFNQVGGFVIEEGINFGHLKALLRMFAEEFADAKEIKVTPGYFPFTEPSVELYAKHPEMGWIELAGAGIFRPELVKPLVGKHVPVIAWGVGLDRLAMFKLGIKDIRQLFSHDLEFLRNVRMV